jgi:hypothetical protein
VDLAKMGDAKDSHTNNVVSVTRTRTKRASERDSTFPLL